MTDKGDWHWVRKLHKKITDRTHVQQVVNYYVTSKSKEKDKSIQGKTREQIYKLENLEDIKKNYMRIYNRQDLQDAYIVKWKLELADQEIKDLSPRLRNAF